MREELGTPAALVGMIALSCLFGGLVLAIFPGWTVIGAWLRTPEAPAWVQAIGSIAAIAAGFLYVRAQYHLAQQAAIEEKRAARRRMLVAVRSAVVETASVARTAERASKDESYVHWENLVVEAERATAGLEAFPLLEIGDADVTHRISIMKSHMRLVIRAGQRFSQKKSDLSKFSELILAFERRSKMCTGIGKWFDEKIKLCSTDAENEADKKFEPVEYVSVFEVK